ncbi:hypothetical protein EZV62_027639 [Acer yangbiense]|uniref:VQ domain-containing protein n=1 Tax=Acer yangbiense TaxID=1000413 RepID=A0A5C7GUX8_9ROSI|nr:hypothetical protein EZV62_027639 [Acer yangbiense]
MSSSNDQWVQHFYHQSMEGGDEAAYSSIAFSDSMITTTTSTVTTPSNNSSTSDHHHQYHLSPKGCGSKPVRRRSRASKKTPTTLLNANTTNFRALVQQFTGCPSTPFSFGSSKKGPVNLSFGLGSNDAFGNNNQFFQQQYQPQKQFHQQQEQQHQQVYQEQQSLVSFDYDHHSVIGGTSDDGFLTNPRSGNNYPKIPDGLDIDEISMHEITAGSSAFSSEDRNNSYFL